VKPRAYLGDPSTQATGHKARQMRAQAASTGTPAPGTDKHLIGRKAVGTEPVKVRHAQAKGVITRKRGNT
jgi:hypothetical protein